MPNTNFFELEDCLESLLPLMEKYPGKSYVQELKPSVLDALHTLQEGMKEVDSNYVDWRLERGDEKLAHKHLHRTFKRAQRKLNEAGAIGYPNYTAEYLDRDGIQRAAGEMIEYLKEHQDSLDFAEESIDALSRLVEQGSQGREEVDEAKRAYLKIAATRKQAREKAIGVIKDFRERARADLGVENEDYQAVDWPPTISPDTP